MIKFRSDDLGAEYDEYPPPPVVDDWGESDDWLADRALRDREFAQSYRDTWREYA